MTEGRESIVSVVDELTAELEALVEREDALFEEYTQEVLVDPARRANRLWQEVLTSAEVIGEKFQGLDAALRKAVLFQERAEDAVAALPALPSAGIVNADRTIEALELETSAFAELASEPRSALEIVKE